MFACQVPFEQEIFPFVHCHWNQASFAYRGVRREVHTANAAYLNRQFDGVLSQSQIGPSLNESSVILAF